MAVVGMTYECTHAEAVRRCALWLRNSRQYSVVMSERRCTNVSEQPDVIGWHGSGHSILIECKVSRSDFLADKRKAFRQYEEYGVGQNRYYAAPKGVLCPEEMPEGWGLLEIHRRQIREAKRPDHKETNKGNEVAMLVSAIRRLEMSATVFVIPQENDNDER